MPGIKISRSLKSSLPEDQREGIEDFLVKQSNNTCYLCDRQLNRATDDIEVDHAVPTSENGAADRKNLKLVHLSCNRAKRNFPTGDIKPYLRLKAFAHERGGVIRYADAQEHFGFTPRESALDWKEGESTATLQLPDGRVESVPVFTDKDGRGHTYYYSFASLPREAIFNDNECQPRSIKLNQAWAIYADTENNPLHEPPSCRVVPGERGNIRLVMFDGQHKSVAMWMHGHKTVVAKIYWNLDKDQTIRLVGSIQSQIKKLPLSSFETALKMGEEWSAAAERYENEVGVEEASEKGLIDSIDPQDRPRARKAFRNQLIRDILELEPEDLKILQFVEREGQEKKSHQVIKEKVFTDKVVVQLRHMTPLPDKGENREKARARELENIKFALNTLVNYAFLNSDAGIELTGLEELRRDRMKSQGALIYISGLLKSLYDKTLAVDEPTRAMLEKEPSEEQQRQIQIGIRRIVDHPIWVCDWNISEKTKAVANAMSKNQDITRAFRDVELRAGYVLGVEELSDDWYK